ncbi:5'-nucleotidase C-terminal domain-containing protein [Halobacterium wangiae]|uniref:5'-nucleotidase C-terminal domain-containing protein n=1 Tax=Halobacterium wangiae TaxID=2902623 RepID=UPI001E2E312B|nr:5'-nucleotidase C-terminal domain-containing protein [Halobacterium wangiae]
MPSPGPVLRYFNDTERAYDDPSRIGWLAAALREGTRSDCLVIDGGDSTALGALSLEATAETDHALPFFEAVSPAVHVPGNHDFDDGDDQLAAVQAQTAGRWLAANVRGGGATFESHAVFERAGRRIGVVGVAHPDTVQMARLVSRFTAASADLSADLAVGDPVAAARRGLARLRDCGVDHTVVASHCGPTSETIAAETDADVVLGGHDHRRVVRTVDGTVVARTEGHGRAILDVHLDDRSVTVRDASTTNNDVAAHYRERLADAGLDGTVTTFEDELGSTDVRELAARALRETTGADVAAVPYASIRGELTGESTAGDVAGVVPFRLPTVTFRVPGATLHSLLAAADEATDLFERTVWSGADPNTGGIDAKPADATEYRLATVRGLLRSRLFPEGPATAVESEHSLLHRVLVEYLQQSTAG